ncbi:GDYXXLXY domain-containing protein [Lutibacter sp.]|uniref:GDYXXLXY domain-containing protein n=1 Tax=Lutibacter sp. TaxID=1925666 RepID=UPI003562C964
MKNKTLLISLFIVVAFMQLFVPAKMILTQESILKTGTAFKFKTTPIDPSDPFRGKYIDLNFEENKFKIQNKKDWVLNEDIYVLIENNNQGFAVIKDVVKEKPSSEINFIKAKVQYIQSYKTIKNITIEYPFQRFYMEESKAKEAENLHREALKNEYTTTYALVYLKNGEAVLKNVFINNTPIQDAVMHHQNN